MEQIRRPTTDSRASHDVTRPWLAVGSAENEGRDRGVLAYGASDHERMEKLVIAKHGGDRIGPPAGVDERARRVEASAREKQPDDCRSDCVEKLGKDDDSYPAEHDGEQGLDPPRPLRPGKREQSPAGRPRPDDREDGNADTSGKSEHPKRRIRARDEDVDHGVVETSKASPLRRPPRDPVVERTRREHRHDAHCVRRNHDFRFSRICRRQENRARDDG